MPKTKFLSESEKSFGRKCMYIEESINGLAYPLLGDTLVYLLAVYFSAGNMALGYISSATYIAGLILPFVSIVFQGKNQIKLQSLMWYLRGLVCLFFLLLLVTTGFWARTVLLVVFTLFCIFRMIGVAINDFTVKSISSPSNRGRVVADANVAYQSSSIVIRLITGFVLGISRFSGLLGMVFLQMIGVLCNLVSAHYVGKIPCRSTVTYTKGHGILYQIKKSMANPSLQRRLYLRWFSTMVIVVFGMSVPFMRIVLGVSSSLVMFYSVCLGLAVVFAGLVSKNFADRLGSKPLAIFSSLFSIICLLLWAMLPHEVSYLWFFLLGFFTNFFLSLVSLLVVRLVAQVMPDDEAVSFNSMVNFVIAIFALAAGFLSGLMANMSDVATHIFSISGRFIGNPYTLVFLFALGVDVIVLVLSTRLQEVGSYSTHDAAAVVFSLHGLQAVSMIEKLSKTVDPTKRRALLLALGSNLNNIATSEMREILAYPFSPDKEDAIRSLGEKPRKALLDDLIKIAVDDDSYVQLEAIAALGSYKGEDKARQALVNLLHGHWSSVRSMASRSLARMTMGPEYLEEINQLSLSARHIDEEIDFLIAKRNMDKEGLFYKDFFLSVLQKRSASFRQTRYAVLASFLKFGSPRLARLYEEMNNGDVDDFLTDFLTEAKDLPQIDENYAMIFDAFSKNDWGAVRTFCLGMLDICDVSFNSSFENLRLGILKAREMDIACFDIQDALAELYFCYSLEKNSRK